MEKNPKSLSVTIDISPFEEVFRSLCENFVSQVMSKAQPTKSVEQPVESKLLRRKEAAKYLGVSLSTLDELAKTGKIPGYRMGERGVRYKIEELEKSLQKMEQ